jgi:hypothetical protein
MSHLTIATTCDSSNGAAFYVTVRDETHRELAHIDALSAAHARRVAADVILLIRQRDPLRPVVLDNSIEIAPR